jgi:hypothetical protein
MFSSRVDRWCWVMGARLAPLAVARLGGGAGVDWYGVDWYGVDWYGVDWYGVDWLGGVGDGAFRWQPSNPCRQSISSSRARATTLIGSRRGMRTSQPPKSLMARQPLQSPRRRCAPLETFARPSQAPCHRLVAPVCCLLPAGYARHCGRWKKGDCTAAIHCAQILSIDWLSPSVAAAAMRVRGAQASLPATSQGTASSSAQEAVRAPTPVTCWAYSLRPLPG